MSDLKSETKQDSEITILFDHILEFMDNTMNYEIDKRYQYLEIRYYIQMIRMFSLKKT